ncbi:MAG: cobyrinate a,c-diamide synthase [Roseburia sp.]|nr:cobyrinate a,c-diamide synthase [Roseburia sp.]
MKVPRILIGAVSSGSGKTLITCALLQALCDRGQHPAAFKCGPDYIDPMFHRKVLGVPSKNLDTFFTGETMTKKLLAEPQIFDKSGEWKQDISIIEGVMGLYDGLGGIREEGSAYHLAKVTKTPVVLIIDAHGMGKSLLAVIAGFLAYDREHLIKGVILNRTSKMFFQTIKPEIENSFPIAALGYFPKQEQLSFESRHLGLKLPEEIEDIREKIKCAAKSLQETVDIGKLLEIAGTAEEIEEENQETVGEIEKGERIETAGEAEEGEGIETDLGENSETTAQDAGDSKKKVSIAVAYDEAFCFYYEDNLRLLEKLGAEILSFSPLHDTHIPDNAAAVLLGGGYPELYAEKLAENEAMKRDMREKIQGGMPAIAECGGFMYLHETLENMEGQRFPMVGVVPADCHYQGKLVRFGYVEIWEKKQNFLQEGEKIKGHEFHYFDSTANGGGCVAEKPVSGRMWDCVWNQGNCWFGFPHLYYYSNPAFARSFIEKARNYQKKEKL